ncbi:VOC family protein [Brevundimonas sp.]|uniref:VOC family protein n=1 Tax=Brevundimonas sp. TaxID=1871086 RepID=UPI0027379947|nr:VOC family protein [Brevundimonas sp.]MDP3803079.1 VOC family protein [Brevundimonas sp.]
MLKDRNSSAIVAVSDIDRARVFYEEVLGLTLVPGQDEKEVLGFRTGDTRLTVYRSDFAGTNKANAVTWEMKGDLVETVKALKGRGVTFEHYPDMGLTLNGDIHEAGPARLVWFKDPDGNILHLVEGM